VNSDENARPVRYPADYKRLGFYKGKVQGVSRLKAIGSYSKTTGLTVPLRRDNLRDFQGTSIQGNRAVKFCNPGTEDARTH